MEIKKFTFHRKCRCIRLSSKQNNPFHFFKVIKKVETLFWRSAKKSNVLLKQYRKNIPSILLLLKVEEMLFLIIC